MLYTCFSLTKYVKAVFRSEECRRHVSFFHSDLGLVLASILNSWRCSCACPRSSYVTFRFSSVERIPAIPNPVERARVKVCRWDWWDWRTNDGTQAVHHSHARVARCRPLGYVWARRRGGEAVLRGGVSFIREGLPMMGHEQHDTSKLALRHEHGLNEGFRSLARRN